MFRIGIRKCFSAAHHLEGHPGKCAGTHGHTWTVEAVFAIEDLGAEGLVVDFGDAGRALEVVIEPFDHSYLNLVEPFTELQPTAENVARVVFAGLRAEARRLDLAPALESVTVWESADTWASYSP